MPRRLFNGFMVHFDSCGVFNLCTKGNPLTLDGDASGRNKSIGFAPAYPGRVRKIFVESHENNYTLRDFGNFRKLAQVNNGLR